MACIPNRVAIDPRYGNLYVSLLLITAKWLWDHRPLFKVTAGEFEIPIPDSEIIVCIILLIVPRKGQRRLTTTGERVSTDRP